MAGFKSIEEIKVWQEGINLVLSIYKIVNAHQTLKSDFGFKDQIQKSALSIPSNIAEGHERGSKKEFIRFLYIAKGSCGELRTQLYVGNKIGYVEDATFKQLNEQCRKISSMMMKLIQKLH